MRMHILYVTQIVPYPPHGGVLQRGYNLLRELGREHRVRLLAFHHPDELPPGEAVETSRRELRSFCEDVEYFRLWPKRSRLHTAAALATSIAYQKPFSVLAQRNARLHRRLQELCRGPDRPDIVHLDTIALAPYASDCAGVPCVLAHHNVESQLMHRRGEHERGLAARAYVRSQARRLERYEAETCNRFAVNVMVSDADARMLAGISAGARTAVVPNGVDTHYFTPRGDQQTPTVIFTGGMNMFANRDAVEWFLDDVWPEVLREVSEARFVAIGQRPSPKILAMAARDPSVSVPGHVPDVRPWVGPAAVYVVPMRVGGGTRLKVLDAMAQGKALVATNLGAEGIEAEDGRHLVLADTASDFARRVVELLRDPERRHELGEAARQRAEERYAWPVIGRRLVEAYTMAIEASRT
jgi:sugar transferase (PEP-CTERM/EpsH1 system associated)